MSDTSDESDDLVVIEGSTEERLLSSVASVRIYHHYNPENTPPKGISWYAAVFLIVNAALGAGLLNFPYAYSRAGGIPISVAVQLVLTALATLSLLSLAYCAGLCRQKTYENVIEAFLGIKAKQLCALGIAIYCYGTCITFFIIIGDQYDRLFASLYGSNFCEHWYLSRNFTISLSSTLLILPLCFPKRIDFLKYVSMFGVFVILYVVYVIFYEFYSGQNPTLAPVELKPVQWMDLFQVVPVICFGYQCHISSVPIYSCLAKRNLESFSKAVVVSIIICTFCYIGTGIIGYLTFGSHVHGDILESYEGKDSWILVAIGAVAVKSYLTYPILQYCGRIALEGFWITTRGLSMDDVELYEVRRRITISLLWFVTSLGITLAIPSIGIVIKMLGCLAAIFIFVFPGLCSIQANLIKDPTIYLNKDKLLLLGNVLFVAFGAFLFGVSLTQNLSQVFRIGLGGDDRLLCVRNSTFVNSYFV